MSDLIRDSFTQFYVAIGKSYQALNSDRVKIEDRKSRILELLKENIKVPKPPAGAGEYQELCREMLRSAELQLESWRELVRQQVQRSEFVNRHEKSILALVFADVNAGKSSLGNFVGGWNLRDTAYQDLYQPHDCEIEDYSKASQEDRQVRTIDHFPENATEATSTIQHYTLAQGLTWVDTPGLHSLTAEHGELAQEYIQFADLVVYLTPSSSPFKSDEREMLEKLFQMGKPVILAITKSDYTAQKVENGRIVNSPLPKSPENRKKQETFVTEELQEISGNKNLENSHVLSLSVKLARKAVEEEDSELYAASNLNDFLTQMGAILSEKAVELKMRRPKSEINSFIDLLTGRVGSTRPDMLTIAQLQESLAATREKLRKVLDICKRDEMTIYADVDRQLPTALSLLFRSLRDRGFLGNSDTVAKEMSESISRLVAENCRKRLEHLGSTVISLDLPPVKVKTDGGTGYKLQYMEQIVTHQEERAPRGFGENFIHFFNKDKKFYQSVSKSEKIPVGDNFKIFLDAQIEHVRPEVRSHISATINHMAAACINPLMECYQDLERQLKALAAELEQLRFN